MFAQLPLLNGGNSLRSSVSCTLRNPGKAWYTILPFCRIWGRDMGFGRNSASDGRKPIAVLAAGREETFIGSENCLGPAWDPLSQFLTGQAVVLCGITGT